LAYCGFFGTDFTVGLGLFFGTDYTDYAVGLGRVRGQAWLIVVMRTFIIVATISAVAAVIGDLLGILPLLVPKGGMLFRLHLRLFRRPGWKRNSLMPISIYRIRMRADTSIL